MDSSISAVDTALANLCYDSNKTYINGGKIYTGTITATQIASKAITADKLNVTSLSAISANLGSVTAGSINIGSGKFIVTSAGAFKNKDKAQELVDKLKKAGFDAIIKDA